MMEDAMPKIVDLIDRALDNHDNDAVLMGIKKEVNALMHNYPLYA
jgi:glycine hydroxymethyltransferase